MWDRFQKGGHLGDNMGDEIKHIIGEQDERASIKGEKNTTEKAKFLAM